VIPVFALEAPSPRQEEMQTMNQQETVALAGQEPEPSRRVHRVRRVVGVVALAVASLGFAAGCGSDSESSEDAFCEAADSLRANVEGIGEIDVVAGGTDAISDVFSAIESDLQQLKDSGSDVAADEISALESSVDELDSAIGALGDDISVDAGLAVGNAASSVAAAAGDLLDRLSTTCS